MKKILWAVVGGILCIGLGTELVRAEERSFYLGFRAGLGVGSQSPDPGETDGSRTAVTAGGVLGFPVTPNVAVETGLLYVLRGAKYAGANTQGESNEFTAKLDYLVIPAVARATFGPAEGVRPFVLGGLDLGILTKAEYDPEDGDAIDVKDDMKSTDLSLRLGGGASIPAGGYDFVFELAYSLGLADITDFEGGDDDSSVKNRTVTVTAGVDF